jgi:hypothetical protein
MEMSSQFPAKPLNLRGKASSLPDELGGWMGFRIGLGALKKRKKSLDSAGKRKMIPLFSSP